MLTSLLAGAAGLTIVHARGQQLLSVQTASMVPVFRPHDALLIVPTKPTDLRVGQIISYRSPLNDRIIISHRLLAAHAGQLTTAGDATGSPDPIFSADRVVGRAVAVAPSLGFLLDWLHTPRGLILLVYLPALAIVAGELYMLLARSKLPAYRLDM